MPKTKKAAPKKKAAKKATKKPYTLKVLFNDKEFSTNAVSIKKALEEFINSKEFDLNVKTRVALLYTDGKTTRNAIYPVPRARKMFRQFSTKEVAIEIFANQLNRGLE